MNQYGDSVKDRLVNDIKQQGMPPQKREKAYMALICPFRESPPQCQSSKEYPAEVNEQPWENGEIIDGKEGIAVCAKPAQPVGLI